ITIAALTCIRAHVIASKEMDRKLYAHLLDVINDTATKRTGHSNYKLFLTPEKAAHVLKEAS
ncbi:UDP-3-O-(3-hydroxymyristoyl)glucosamine N-acyltransferase, partial [Xylella fastidiosa]